MGLSREIGVGASVVALFGPGNQWENALNRDDDGSAPNAASDRLRHRKGHRGGDGGRVTAYRRMVKTAPIRRALQRGQECPRVAFEVALFKARLTERDAGLTRDPLVRAS
jgi:hypothetical protein